MSDGDDIDFNSLKEGSTDAEAIETYYDDWAENYDDDLKNWDYTAPQDAAAMLAEHLMAGARILDVGCGTGLFAAAMSDALDCQIEGIDISESSLKQAAARGGYAQLQRVDLQQTPLSLADNSVDAAASIGVFTYIADPAALLTDLCRIIRPGGHLLFTHRSDRWRDDNFKGLIEMLTARGLCETVAISDPKPYLPKHEDFKDEIEVIFAHLRVTAP